MFIQCGEIEGEMLFTLSVFTIFRSGQLLSFDAVQDPFHKGRRPGVDTRHSYATTPLAKRDNPSMNLVAD
jgi:hypothetical protein